MKKRTKLLLCTLVLVSGIAVWQQATQSDDFEVTLPAFKDLPEYTPATDYFRSPNNTAADSAVEKLKTVKLTTRNTVTFKGPVTDESVSDVIIKVSKLVRRTKADERIYLVLDTPGGSVDAGAHLIDTLNGFGRKIHTVTIFAASMGFHTAQGVKGRRYITESGTLMSHRAFIQGLAGEIPGEAVVRMKYLLRMIENLDIKASRRIGMPLAEYQELIRDEYWVDGRDAVPANMADEIVQIRCSAGLLDQEVPQKIRTFFGTIDVAWSGCPTVTYPVKIGLDNISAEHKGRITNFVEKMISDKKKFVRDFIANGEFKKILVDGQ